MEEQSVAIQPKSSFLEKISFGLLLAVVFLTPFFFVPSTFVSVQFGSSLLFAFGSIVALLIFIIAKLKNGSFELPQSKLFFLGTIIAVPVVYLITSLVHGMSRVQFLGYTFDVSTVGFILLAFVFLFLVQTLFKTKDRIFFSYIAVVSSSVIVALFLLSRLVFGAGFLSFGLFTSLTATVIGSWNSVGIFFAVGAVLSLLTFEMLPLTKLMKVLVVLALALSLFFLAIVNFQTIWIILAVISLLFFGYKVSGGNSSSGISVPWKQQLKTGPMASLVVLVIALIFTFWGNTLGSSLATKLNVTSIDVRPGLTVTYNIATQTLKNDPLFGSGPNTFTQQWLSYKPADINSTIFWNTDFSYGVGLLPTFAVTTGLLGILSWLLFFALFLYFGFRSLFQKNEDLFARYLNVSSFFVAFFLWVMAFIYVPSVVIFILTFFFTGLFFASLSVQGILPTRTIAFSGNPKVGFIFSLVLVAFFVAASALGYELYKNSVSLWYFQEASALASNAATVDNSEVLLSKAITEVPYDVYYRAQTAIGISKINTALSQDLSKTDPKTLQQFFSDELTKAITAGLNARNSDSTNYLNWISLGQAYEVGVPQQTNVAGAYDSANLAYSQAQKLNPQNPGINLLFARLEVDNKNIKKAEQYTLSAIQQKQNYIDAYFLLTQLEVADNNIKGAIDSTSVAAVIDPSNPSTFFQLGLLKYNNSDYSGAIDALQKSIALAPDYANAKYFLGLSLYQRGDALGAVKQFQDLAISNPDNADVKLILANLQSGKAPFANAKPPVSTPEKGSQPPVQETNQ